MYALGQPVTLIHLVTDGVGTLVNATTAALTITLPDGTTVSPTVANPPVVTGTYTVTYTPTLPGLHAVRWVFGGTNAAAPLVDSFYVQSSTVGPLVSLAEAREQLQLSSTVDDVALQRLLLAASGLCERRTRVWRRRTVVLTTSGGSRRIGLARPSASVTTVTEDGVALASTEWILDGPRGRLWRLRSGNPAPWAAGVQNVVVTYVAGPADGMVPDDILRGLLLLIQHSWDAGRGGSGLPGQDGVDFSYPAGFALPNAVREWWQPWLRRPVG